MRRPDGLEQIVTADGVTLLRARPGCPVRGVNGWEEVFLSDGTTVLVRGDAPANEERPALTAPQLARRVA